MKKSLLVLSFLGLFGSVADARSSDDVIVDLSVLGEVSAVAKAPTKPVLQVAKKNKSSVAAIPVSAVASEKKVESSLVDLPNSQPKFPVVKPKPLIKPETLKKVIVELKSAENQDTDKLFEGMLEEIKTPDVVSKQEEIELAKIEKTVKKEDVSQNVLSAPSIEIGVVDEKVETQKVVEMKKVVEPVLVEKIEVEVVSQQENTKTVEENVSFSVESKTTEIAKPVELVKPTKLLEAKKPLPNNIYFGEDETELTNEHKAKLSQIMSSFKNKKIRLTIFSYTLNSDEDVHKRRLKSVTRAGEVRKHLISLGYKNSGMKIVNVDEDSGKVNTVEIVEVK